MVSSGWCNGIIIVFSIFQPFCCLVITWRNNEIIKWKVTEQTKWHEMSDSLAGEVSVWRRLKPRSQTACLIAALCSLVQSVAVLQRDGYQSSRSLLCIHTPLPACTWTGPGGCYPVATWVSTATTKLCRQLPAEILNRKPIYWHIIWCTCSRMFINSV